MSCCSHSFHGDLVLVLASLLSMLRLCHAAHFFFCWGCCSYTGLRMQHALLLLHAAACLRFAACFATCCCSVDCLLCSTLLRTSCAALYCLLFNLSDASLDFILRGSLCNLEGPWQHLSHHLQISLTAIVLDLQLECVVISS